MRRFRMHLLGATIDVSVSRSGSDRAVRTANEERANREIVFEGNFSSWDEAMRHAEGYGSPKILERAIAATRAVVSGKAAYERDTVVFEEPQIAYPLLAALLYAASHNRQRLAVMDVGGSLGSSYRQNKPFLTHLQSVRWGVVEQESFVRIGRCEFETEELKFFPDVGSCIEALHPNFLLLSSVIQYLESPYEFLTDALSREIPFVFVDRTMAHRLGFDRLVVQKVPPHIYDASYPVWMLDANRIESIFGRYGYEVLYCFDPHPGSRFGPPDICAPYVGWFIRKTPQAQV